jgi:uncharacterized protein DUF3224
MDENVIEGEFHIQDWKESTVAELAPGAKLTEAKVTQQFSGGLKGEGSVTWCMCYTSPKSARFVGMQHFTGVLGARKGGFILETEGDFDGTVAKGYWSIVPDSGTGELEGIEGEGQFEAPHGPKATWRLEYSLSRVRA